MKLPQSFIDEVLSRTDLVEIIQSRVTLKQTGKANYSGLCPFHQEKSPSFSVNQVKQFYYCFGCKASGNAISFLLTYEKLSFLEAVEFLANKAGLPMPEEHQFKEEKKPDLTLLKEAAAFYQRELQTHKPAQAYLAHRGVSEDSITYFQLGFAPAGWDNLQKLFNQTPHLTPVLTEIGMVIQKENGRSYDRFRDRIMFPIHNHRGQIVGFGGRSLGSQMPKYLNSPETPYFHKSRELYGLYQALQANKKITRIIIVEGYLDVIMLHQHGFTETVATLGTAISSHHIHTLLRFSESLLFCFDGDVAGKTAAWRALEIVLPLMNTGMSVHFLFLPNNQDPDSFIQKVGKAEFSDYLAKATPLVDFFFAKLAAETEISTLSGKTRFVHLAHKYLQKVPRGIFQELLMKRISAEVGLNEQAINELLNKNTAPKTKEAPIDSQKLIPAIRLALSLILQCPKLIKDFSLPNPIQTSELEGMPLLKKVFRLIHQHPDLTTGSLLEHFQDQHERQLASELAAQPVLIPESVWFNELQGALNLIEAAETENSIQLLLTKAKEQELLPDEKKRLQNLLISQKKL